MRPSGAMTLSCSDVVPLETTAAGVDGRFPWLTSPSASALSEARPMKTTSVPGARARQARSSASTSWPATIVTCEETPRWVTGIPAAAGTAATDETPGNDLERDAGLHQRERLLAAASEHERVAALEPHDRRPGARAGRAGRRSPPGRAGRGDAQRTDGRLVDELGATRRS